MLFSNNEEQETSAETTVKPRTGLGYEREAEGSGESPWHPLCVAHVLLSISPPPRCAAWWFTPLSTGATKGCFKIRGILCGPFCPRCCRHCWGEEGYGPSCTPASPCPSFLAPPADRPGFAAGLRGGGGRSCCWILLVNPEYTSKYESCRSDKPAGMGHVGVERERARVRAGGSACAGLPNLPVFLMRFRFCPLLQ